MPMVALLEHWVEDHLFMQEIKTEKSSRCTAKLATPCRSAPGNDCQPVEQLSL